MAVSMLRMIAPTSTMPGLPEPQERDRLRIGERFTVSFQRTLRVPEDGREYPLPPGCGPFGVYPVEALGEGGPPQWRSDGGHFITMYPSEALWLGFGGADFKPNAVQVFAGSINAVSGAAGDEGLRDDPQNYIVAPLQPWLDGFNTSTGAIRQFVATVLGAGLSAEGQLIGAERRGGLDLLVYEPRPGIFEDRPPAAEAPAGPQHGAPMGLGAGGQIRQRVYRDPYGIDTWDPASVRRARVHILDSAAYRALTGRPPPPTPVDAAAYMAAGLPWFDLYDEDRPAVEGVEALARLSSTDAAHADQDVAAGAAAAPLTRRNA
ncbi:hypothetical protein OM076_13640 [Solirubrobacter ginsenosidimutans]|uniref:Integral membrane protein n=1 Tax=Solirubrobacter ginsenosidimutans TaxID=490573 RepID=A0A9X3MU61_9ACTN|nr:hypothetical protein [Solirubrobacter ginsenosidimutans]MDA0161315.1 hypothetical protein [Solirubrobacter ginsenosidimutans]